MRPSQRQNDQIRDIAITTDISMHAAGSCLIKCGNTHVICTASVENFVPRFLKGKGQGWITAEYGMLPGSGNTRIGREAARGKQSGRTQEIQRLIGRSFRAITDLAALGERQITIDCDVIQADGGTRTASITGGYVALHIALNKLVAAGELAELPLTDSLSAISCGIYKGEAVADLDYAEDSNAEVDANFVMTGSGKLVEVQATGEESTFSTEELTDMLTLATKASKELKAIQDNAIESSASCDDLKSLYC